MKKGKVRNYEAEAAMTNNQNPVDKEDRLE